MPARGASELLLAAERAVDIGAQLLRQSRAHIGALIAKGDRDFATGVDLRIEAAVKRSLARAAPDIPFLGEEFGGRPGSPSLQWVLDPIDGTVNFARESPLCAISLSLLRDGQPELGIVDAPLLAEHFIARRGHGAYLNGNRLVVSEVGVLHEAIVALADFKVGAGSVAENRIHLNLLAKLARGALRTRMHGSAALDLAWLAAGRVNATLMLSNLPWDVTAGLLLVREAGGVVYDFDASDHDARSRFTLASEAALVTPITRLVREAM